MQKNILFIFFIVVFFTVRSQKLNIQFFNTDNGLPQNSVKDIIKDKYGFIWMTTENGIVRYDGTNFLVYKNFPLTSQRFTYFYGHPEKDSIYTTGDYGKTILLHDKLPKVTKIAKKTLFLIKDNSGHLLYCTNYTSGATAGVKYFMNFKEGRYYLTETGLGYTHFGSKREKILPIKPLLNHSPQVFALNEILFYRDIQAKKVVRIEKGKITGSYQIPLLTDPVSIILWNQVNNQVFILNKSTMYACDYEKGELKISKLFKLDKVKDENFVSAYYDKSYKKFYLGNRIDGLQIISLPDFTTVSRPHWAPDSNFYTLLPYNSSSVITTFGEIYDRNGMVDNKHFKNANSYFLSYDHSGNIITQRTGEVMVYQKSSSFTRAIPIKDIELSDFFFDDLRYYGLLQEFKNDKTPRYNTFLTIYKDKSFQFPGKKVFINSEPTKFVKLDQDHILVGTIKGLYKVSLKTNTIYDLTGKSELLIRNIIKSKDGNIWIMALGKGLFLLKNNCLIKMPLDVNNNISSTHGILEDSKGFFWIPTNNGLYKVSERQLLQYARNRKSRVDYYRFAKDSGFNTNEFNGGSNLCGSQLANGDFVLPSLNGLVFFNPLKVTAYYPENIYIERASIDNKQLYFKENLYLKQEFSRVDIFIDVPYYSNPDNLVIEAKLTGMANAKWEPIGKDGKFSISNLGYGNHTFVVKMLVSDSGKFIYKKINIIIPPYFYQTLWFKMFTLSISLLLVYFLIRWRISFLKKKNHELEEVVKSRTKTLSDTVDKLEITKIKLHKEIEQQKKLIGTITHDITTPVKFIALTAKEILDNNDLSTPRAEKILNSIYKSSDQLYNFTITLKEYADIYTHHRSDKTEIYSLYKLIEEKKILFNEIAEKKNTVIRNHANRALLINISKNILSAIVHNLMDNSVKYTENGIITIESHVEGENIHLLITDTGIGMDDKKIEYYTKLQDNIENEKLLLQKYGMGLHLVLQLLQMIEGKIIFTKNYSKGTSFRLILTNKKDD